MERVYAFTDEYGAFGWDIENPGVSTHFIITAVIVKESELASFRQGAEIVRKQEFQSGEMKSKTIGSKDYRREKIIKKLLPLPFSIFVVCIDKKTCLDNMSIKGLQYKKSFYKFMNNIVHIELRRAFKQVTIIADEMIDNEYMQSFVEYVKKCQDLPTLFGDAEFCYNSSTKDVGIQVADFISGTLARVYDRHKHTVNTPDYFTMLESKLTHLEMYPKTYQSYVLDSSAVGAGYDKDIAELCFAQAAKFIEHHKDDDDPMVKAQVATVNYLLFRFMNNNGRKYIGTHELLSRIAQIGLSTMTERSFRQNVIGKIRDSGVIIASSTKGYKIPSSQAELYDYVNHDASIVIPMLARLKKCRDLVKLGTVNNVDLLAQPEYQAIKKYLDLLPSDTL